MAENIKEFFNTILDFCRENQHTVMIVGAGVVVLIILIAVIRSLVRRSGRNDELDFDEEEFVRSLAYSKKQREEALYGAESAPRREEAPGTAAYERPQAEAPAQTEKFRTRALLPDELMGEIAENITGNLQELDIKIQNAELKFKYAGAGAQREAQSAPKEAAPVRIIEPERVVEISEIAAAPEAGGEPAASDTGAVTETTPAAAAETDSETPEAGGKPADAAETGDMPEAGAATEAADAALADEAVHEDDAALADGTAPEDDAALAEDVAPEDTAADDAAPEAGEGLSGETGAGDEPSEEPEQSAEATADGEPAETADADEPAEATAAEQPAVVNRPQPKERRKVRELTQSDERPSFQDMLRFSAERRNRGYSGEPQTQADPYAWARGEAQEGRPQPQRQIGGNFGPNNRNVSRSGKVFTEEELMKQIKD